MLTGMHRSGTSFLAKRLAQSGLAFPGDLLPPAEDNPEGYWEAREVVSLNNSILQAAGQDWRSDRPLNDAAIDTLVRTHGDSAREVLERLAARAGGQDFAIKDPRLCRLLPIWRSAAQRAGLVIRLAATTRPAREVALSLYRRRRDPRFAPAAIDTPASAVFLWLRYLLDLERHSRDMPRSFVPFRDLRAIASVSDLKDAARRGDAAVSCRGPDSWLTMARSVDTLLTEGDLTASASVFDAAREALDLALDAPDTPGEGASVGGGELRTVRAFTRRPSGCSRSGPVIGFLSGEPGSRGHIYRVENRISALIGEPAGVFRIDPRLQSPEDIASACDLIIVFRRQMDVWFERLAGRAQGSGVPLVFDIDDLVFDPELMVPDVFRFLEDKPPEVREEWQMRARGYRAALQAASHGWATTQALHDEMLNVQPRVSVLKNGLSDHHLRKGQQLEPRGAGRGIVIGYASGTPTHDHDFAHIARPLAQLMRTFTDVRLEIVGPVGPQALGPLMDLGARVSFLPLVDYFSLPGILSRFDMNLAPLEPGNRFCACKSELKFFEAGIVSVPTIASTTLPFQNAIRRGEDGLLAGSNAEWGACLETLASDPELRTSLGAGAARSALAGFGPDAQKREFLTLCQQLLPGFSPGLAGA
ncbi:hypothetical protein [Hyphomonas polymorpha]|uniref:hypothetical protein n=1 Tax=Hyphomonas polymorpha TaxID=74319 RepID=UPI0012F7C305|nr:hypothetical protein [Hyphomonas polymorpha]